MKLVIDIILVELLLDNMPYEELVGYYEYTDADIAEAFAESLDVSNDVAVYVKLPDGFYISTPVAS